MHACISCGCRVNMEAMHAKTPCLFCTYAGLSFLPYCCRPGAKPRSCASEPKLRGQRRTAGKGPLQRQPLGADVSAISRGRRWRRAGASAHEEPRHCGPAQPEAAADRCASVCIPRVPYSLVAGYASMMRPRLQKTGRRRSLSPVRGRRATFLQPAHASSFPAIACEVQCKGRAGGMHMRYLLIAHLIRRGAGVCTDGEPAAEAAGAAGRAPESAA